MRLPIATNSQLEPLVETKIFSNIEGTETVKKDPAVNSTHLKNPEDCLESTIIPVKLDDEYYCNDSKKGESEVKIKPFEIFCDSPSLLTYFPVEKDESKVKVKPFEIFCDSSSQLKFNPEEVHTVENLPQKSASLDLTDSSLHFRDTYCVTPCRDFSKSYGSQQGEAFTSTPLNKQEIKKGVKNVFDNLSIIKEEEESLLDESKDLEIIITEPETLPQATKESISTETKNKPEFSLLRKDELSLLIDIPNEKKLTEKKVDVNNLTLSIKNSESVVYKNILDKTVDDFLIEGNELERIRELCNLEIESDRKEILDKALALKPFVSCNADENRDNNDPEWELMRKLETDDERYKAVRKLWRNLAIPDLKQNLSTFNWRKKNSLPTLKNIVPIKTNPIGKRKKNLVYDCTEVFDVGIKKLEDFCRRQFEGVKLDSDNDTSIMASLNKKPRLDSGPAHVANRDYQKDFDKINECFQERLSRFTDAKQEIKAVHGFYNGLKNQGNGGYGNVMLIGHKERQHILEIEEMINHYTVWYP
ncbi:uncharacterized protein PF3D7_1120000 isoform X2 [Halyomorpha halys]|nr:uncharacterized protein LOC106686266 isoform X2 [Halyomorpha halys]